MGLNSMSQDRVLGSFISHGCLLMGGGRKSENIWPGWDEANENASEPKGSLSQRAGEQGRNGACRKELVSYIPVPTLRKNRKRRQFPSHHTPPTSPHTHSSTSVHPLCCPPCLGERGGCEEGEERWRATLQSGFHSPALARSLQSSDA